MISSHRALDRRFVHAPALRLYAPDSHATAPANPPKRAYPPKPDLGHLATLSNIDQYTRRERKLTWDDPAKYGWGLVRLFFRSFGRLSESIDEGWNEGHDSGHSLELVYKNDPKGKLLVGKWLDAVWLNGWSDMRQRRELLIEACLEASDLVLERFPRIQYFDPAAGTFTYCLDIMDGINRRHAARLEGYRQQQLQAAAAAVLAQGTDGAGDALEALRRMTANPPPPEIVRGHFRDYEHFNVARGQQRINDRGYSKSVSCRQGDAFNFDQLVDHPDDARPNFATVSGFWELYSSNQMVFDSMWGIFQALEPGGILCATAMHHNPKINLCAQALQSHQAARSGEDIKFNMPERRLQEVLALKRRAGFEILDVRLTDKGLFPVITARKPFRAEEKKD